MWGRARPTDNSGTAEVAAVDQHRAHRALSARWLGAHPRRDLDHLQPRRQARAHQRPDQRRTERPDRIPEDAMKNCRRKMIAIIAAGGRVSCGASGPDSLQATQASSTARRRSNAAAAPQVPRFRFENFTTANGLPDNHVYAVLVDGDRIWAGTDNGLGVYSKTESGRPTRQGRPGASRRAFAGAGQAHGRCVGRHHGRAEPHLRRAHRQLHAVELRG
jgi:hypothetical protein